MDGLGVMGATPMAASMLNWVSRSTRTSAGEDEQDKLRQLEELGRYCLIDAEVRARIGTVADVIKSIMGADAVTISLLPQAGIERIAVATDWSLSATPQKGSLTEACVAHGDIFVVPSLTDDARFVAHPAVANSPYARMAVASPLVSARGVSIGSVNLWYLKQEEFGSLRRDYLKKLTRIVCSELDLALAAKENEQHSRLFSAVFENVGMGIAINKSDGMRVAVNTRLEEILGFSREELLSTKSAFDVQHGDDVQEGRQLFERLNRGEIDSYVRESRYVRKSEEVIWCKTSCSPMLSPDGSERYVIAVIEDITERKNAQEARHLLLGEINHRVKNTLAIVQGIARQLLRVSTGQEEFAIAFEERVQALARSHDMLTKSAWKPMPLDQLIQSMLDDTWEPYKERVRIDCVNVELNAQTTIMLSLVLHELMTNAVKHGSLTSPEGDLEIGSTITVVNGVQWVGLTWQERSSRICRKPERQGLGLSLMDKAPKLGLSGNGMIEFLPAGARCVINFPIYTERKMFRSGLVSA